jgi:hypothetical protein
MQLLEAPQHQFRRNLSCLHPPLYPLSPLSQCPLSDQEKVVAALVIGHLTKMMTKTARIDPILDRKASRKW